ncbi:IS3 family transposase [Trichlorobacter lovleyi]|uniref:IS3 family transposase n=1 Tax=Trichlorobacter lovleyi TaxID=313985 RepID=UPI00129475DA|nr:IS3 family transposase [Trichlorobacter lovleyi]
MKKSKFTEEQILFALRQAETGISVAEVCRKMGISDATYYTWKKKYGGLGLSELRRLKQLEEENRQLKKLVADLSLDKQMLQDVLFKKVLKPAQRRNLVRHLHLSYGVSERRSCDVVLLCRGSYRYVHHGKDDSALRLRIRQIAETRIRYGYLRIHTLLRREGWHVNHKRVYRIYCEECLNLRRKRPRRRVSAAHRANRPVASSLNDSWSMDFVADSLFNGRRFRALTVVDNWSRQCLAIRVDQAMKGDDVVDAMSELTQIRNCPKRIFLDNGSEFISKSLDRWAYENGVTLDFSRPGKPTDNALIESFNGSFRDECLSVNWFLSMDDARQKIEDWRQEYNDFRPHTALKNLTPNEYANQFQEAGNL